MAYNFAGGCWDNYHGNGNYIIINYTLIRSRIGNIYQKYIKSVFL